MLETTGTLSECERILRQELEKVSLIGQIPLTVSDIETLNHFIADNVRISSLSLFLNNAHTPQRA